MSSSTMFIQCILKMIRFQDQARRRFRNPPRGTESLDPRKVKGPLKAEGWSVDGSKLLTISAKGESQKHLLYFPGGAYLLEATPFHRQFVEKLVKLTGIAATILDYPKAPEFTYEAAHQRVVAAYQALRERHPEVEFILGGDSAGGGLALTFLQTLREKEVTPLPSKTVLISPWLDLNLSHPAIPAYQERDLILPLDSLREATRLYAGGADLINPLLSPLYGDPENLGRILLTFGTEEIFYPDCQLFLEKARAAPGTRIEVIIGEDQVHAWPVFPFPESRSAVELIAKFMTGNGN